MPDNMSQDFVIPNKSKFKSPEHEIYVMKVSVNLWKQMREKDLYGNGGDHPLFDQKLQELGLKKPRK